MGLSMIVAMADNGAIGRDGDMPWRLPADLKHFRKLTLGHKIIMGRKTLESIPKWPLDGRENIVITRSEEEFPGCVKVASIEEALSLCSSVDECFVIGGATVYKQFYAHCDTLYITRVHASPDADTFFPEFREEEWLCTDSVYHPKDEKHTYDFSFQTLIRR